MNCIKVVKRNGDIVDFDSNKIKIAVGNAYMEVNDTWNENILSKIANDIEIILRNCGEKHTVEFIQDTVENYLMQNFPSVAKRFILYRQERESRRAKGIKKYQFLSDEFLSKYKHKPDPLNELGSFVFYRTYARFLEDEGRRERWWETVARAVDHNMSLSSKSTTAEAERLYDNIYNLKQQLSGRALFAGGSEASRLYSLSMFNCSFEAIKSIHDFADLFYVLMVGTGAGVGVNRKYTDNLPPFRTDIELVHVAWEFTPKEFREDVTTIEVNGDTIKLIIGDSKEGFVEALRLYLDIMSSHSYRTIKRIIVDYNYVRPKGERLRVFGGYASGHECMKIMIDKIHKLICSKKNDGTTVKLNPIDVMDIANIIGENVVSGGKL